MGSVSEQHSRRVSVLPRVVEDLARDHAEDTWVTVPKSSDLAHGWRNVTYQELASAVDGFAGWAEQELGVGNGTDVVAYIGVNDLRYGVVLVGLMKAGYKPMLPSPRNSPEGQQSLLETTKAKAVFCSEGIDTQVDIIRNAVPDIRICQIPAFDDLYTQGRQAGSYKGHYSDAEDDQALVLHTSGSTGLPKPIHITNGGLATIGALKLMPAPEGHHNAHEVLLHSDEPLFVMTPFFHAMGAIMMTRSMFCKGPLVLLPADRPPNVELIVQVLEQSRPWGGIFAPSMLEQIVETPGGLDILGKLEYVFYGGAPLAHDSGEKINEVTNVVSMIGSTEAGLIPNQLPADKRDWEYFEWSLGSGVEMEPDTEGLYEMVIKKHEQDLKYQGIFHTFPDLEEWRTKDLYQRHPSKPNLWLYKGRKDDVLVLNNGEKFNPVGFEKILESHPVVNGAVVVGQGRFQTGLLIEPDWKSVSPDEDAGILLDRIWPTIEKANAEAPAHGRVWRSKVAIAKKDKPFKRAPKGTTIRRQTVDLYHSEIDALYSNEASDEELGKLEQGSDLPTIEDFLRKAFKLKGLAVPEDASDDADLFSFGVDSLQVLALSSTLGHACGGGKDKTVSPRVIYTHPTIKALAKFLQGSGDDAKESQDGVDREVVMAKMVEKYTQDLTQPSSTPSPASSGAKHSVILTGSTGSLGNYLLENLMQNPDVEHIFCLNRSADAEDRQRHSFEARGVATGLDWTKTTFLHTDFSKPHFNLADSAYENLLKHVDLFIHNAWAVDFNKSLASYENVHIAGTRRCVDFSAASQRRAHVIFISSIASVGNWRASHPNDAEVPETLPDDFSLPLPQGYGESKHVASRILATAAERAGVPSTTIRAGQLAGPSGQEGIEWNRHEWLPSIVISSRAMGVLPEKLGNQDVVDWVPVDLAARTVVDIAFARSKAAAAGEGGEEEKEMAGVAHLVNPRTVSWSALVPDLQASLERTTGEKCDVVPFRQWLDKLKEASPTKEEVEAKPGIKLVDFYEGLAAESGGLPRLATRETVKMSATLREMQPISGELMQRWNRRWME